MCLENNESFPSMGFFLSFVISPSDPILGIFTGFMLQKLSVLNEIDLSFSLTNSLRCCNHLIFFCFCRLSFMFLTKHLKKDDLLQGNEVSFSLPITVLCAWE